CELVYRYVLKSVLGDDLRPDSGRVGHLLLQRRWAARVFAPRKAEIVRDLSPEPSPSEHIAVDDIERRIGGGRRRRRPVKLLRQDARVRHVGDGVILFRRAGIDEGSAGMSADR